MISSEIHDNGGRPYKVEFDPQSSTVRVFHISDVEDPNLCSAGRARYIKVVGNEPFVEFPNVARCFFGHDKIRKPETDGNTVLVCLDEQAREYVFIGNRGVEKFTLPEVVVRYYSPIGPSDVPYPYAVAASEDAYLMLEHIGVKFDRFSGNPNGYYYGNDRSRLYKSSQCKFGAFDIEANEDRDKLLLSYEPDPIAEYERLSKFLRDMYYIDKAGVKHKLDLETFVRLTKEHETKFGLYTLPPITEVINPRKW